jgi:hypothetical protein
MAPGVFKAEVRVRVRVDLNPNPRIKGMHLKGPQIKQIFKNEHRAAPFACSHGPNAEYSPVPSVLWIEG